MDVDSGSVLSPAESRTEGSSAMAVDTNAASIIGAIERGLALFAQDKGANLKLAIESLAPFEKQTRLVGHGLLFHPKSRATFER